MKNLLILDKDGTLVVPNSGKIFCDSPWDQKPIDGVQKKMLEEEYKDWKKVIVSNQGGISAGHKTLEEAFAEMRFCLEMFPQIDEAFLCPDFDGSTCYRVWDNCTDNCRICYNSMSWETIYYVGLNKYRKPSSGMLDLAALIHIPEKILMIGDRPEDFDAAKNAKLPTEFFWAKEWISL